MKVKVILIQEKTSVVLERLKQLEATLWIQSILAQYVPSHLNVKVGSSSICSLTVEKSSSIVHTVKNHSAWLNHWRLTFPLTPARSFTNASYVFIGSILQIIWEGTWKFTVEKDHIPVLFVESHFKPIAISFSTKTLTMEKTSTSVHSVKNHLATPKPLRITSSPILDSGLTSVCNANTQLQAQCILIATWYHTMQTGCTFVLNATKHSNQTEPWKLTL